MVKSLTAGSRRSSPRRPRTPARRQGLPHEESRLACYRPDLGIRDTRYRLEFGIIDLRLKPAGPGYRPELGVIDLWLHPPALDIDRSSGLSTYGSTRRPRISTGARRYRPKAPARRPSISTGARRCRPMAPPAGPGYRPELRVIDLWLRPPALDIDRSWDPRTPDIVKRHPLYAVGRHPLLRTPGCVAGSRFGSVRGEGERSDRSLQPADLGYRPELGDIDRSFHPADPGYRPDLTVIDRTSESGTPDIDRSPAVIDRSWKSETPDIDRTPGVIDRSWYPRHRISTGAPPLSTGAGNPRHRISTGPPSVLFRSLGRYRSRWTSSLWR